MIAFVNKKTGVNDVAGQDKLLQGILGWGCKDYYFLEAAEQFGKGTYTLPCQGEFRKGPHWG